MTKHVAVPSDRGDVPDGMEGCTGRSGYSPVRDTLLGKQVEKVQGKSIKKESRPGWRSTGRCEGLNRTK